MCCIYFWDNLSKKQEQKGDDNCLENKLKSFGITKTYQGAGNMGSEQYYGNVDEIVPYQDGCQQLLGIGEKF